MTLGLILIALFLYNAKLEVGKAWEQSYCFMYITSELQGEEGGGCIGLGGRRRVGSGGGGEGRGGEEGRGGCHY